MYQKSTIISALMQQEGLLPQDIATLADTSKLTRGKEQETDFIGNSLLFGV